MRNRTFDLTTISLMVAVTAVMAQIAIPMPLGVPMTLQTFAVTLAGVVLGAKSGAISMIVYVLMGAFGLPVFSGFKGGFGMLFGPTGGFLLTFPLMAFIIGFGVKYIHDNMVFFWTFLAVGTLINYAGGVLVFSLTTGSGLMESIAACFIPFIPTTIIKAILGGILGMRIREAIPQLKG